MGERSRLDEGVPLVALAGQVPPPFHGQAVAIQSLLESDETIVRFVHVPMNFSSSLDEVGKVRARKVLEVGRVIVRLWRARIRGARTLYYPPAGPNLVPIVRDIAILLATRWMFTATVFHFHASGLSEAYGRLPAILRPLYRAAYRRPDVAIRPSPSAVRDGEFLGARSDLVVFYGIDDPPTPTVTRQSPDAFRLISVGALREGKGTDNLVKATALLVERGHDVTVELVGGFFSGDDASRITELIEHLGLTDRIRLPGVLTGDAKASAYASADIFCFPTHYESEAAPIVLIEAMAHSLPIVTTRWRGVPDVVDRECARLVEPQSIDELVDVLEELILDEAARTRMGASGRRRFTTSFTSDIYRSQMCEALLSATSK